MKNSEPVEIIESYNKSYSSLCEKEKLVWKEIEIMAREGKSDLEIRRHSKQIDSIHKEIDSLYERYCNDLKEHKEKERLRNIIVTCMGAIVFAMILYPAMWYMFRGH